MRVLAFVARQLLGVVQAVGLYVAVVPGVTLIAMNLLTLVGYVDHSDRPGPGWSGLRLAIAVREALLFIERGAQTAMSAVPLGAVLFCVSRVLLVLRTPEWLLAALRGIVALLISVMLTAATGWYIAISGVAVVIAALAGA